LLLAPKADFSFPSEKVFRRLGLKPQRAVRVIAFCETRTGHEDVSALWSEVPIPKELPPDEEKEINSPPVGYVYLFRHGSRSEYKIGRTKKPLRREGELSIQLPEKLNPIHYIETDDPSGIEKYWHARFAGKRKEGEWFALNSGDVRAFKRWKRIN
jgi:hypothetical protein